MAPGRHFWRANQSSAVTISFSQFFTYRSRRLKMKNCGVTSQFLGSSPPANISISGSYAITIHVRSKCSRSWNGTAAELPMLCPHGKHAEGEVCVANAPPPKAAAPPPKACRAETCRVEGCDRPCHIRPHSAGRGSIGAKQAIRVSWHHGVTQRIGNVEGNLQVLIDPHWFQF
jgi:hypothetical protein